MSNVLNIKKTITETFTFEDSGSVSVRLKSPVVTINKVLRSDVDITSDASKWEVLEDKQTIKVSEGFSEDETLEVEYVGFAGIPVIHNGSGEVTEAERTSWNGKANADLSNVDEIAFKEKVNDVTEVVTDNEKTVWNGKANADLSNIDEDVLKEKIEGTVNESITNRGVARFASGSYVGTGTYGEENPNTLTFDFEPKIVVFSEGRLNNHFMYLWGTTGFSGRFSAAPAGGNETDSTKNNDFQCIATTSGNTMKWWHNGSQLNQLNEEGTTITYIAIG